MRSTLFLIVNGQEMRVKIEQDEMLSQVLRDRLGLTGTKIACEEAECGSCTVLLDGKPVLACELPALKAHGREVRTIESLAQHGTLHPLQEAFIRHGAIQCGFCTPGQIMTALGLLETSASPTVEEIRNALKDTLCRCGAYPAIERAVQAAAVALREKQPVESPSFSPSGEYHHIGRPATRPDARAKADGSALFADDYDFPGMLQARVLRAGVPHARVLSIDTSEAAALPGVQAVLTAADVPGKLNHGLVTRDWPALIRVGDKVRYVGDALAIVAADNSKIAASALEKIKVELEPLPVVTGPVEADQPGAPLVHEDGNLLDEIEVVKGDVEGGFSDADVLLEGVYETPTMEHIFMEPECSIARPLPDGRMEIYVGSQIPYADREQVADCLNMPQEQIHVIGTLVGGGFGGKEDIAGQIHAALLAQATGRPVKLLFDRHESLLVHPKRHATRIQVKLGARADGRLTSVLTELYGDTGAYASLGEHVMTRATTHSSGPYISPNVRAICRAMYTNNPPAGAFRGFGALQAAFAIEIAVDELAHRLGMNPIELRKLNALRDGSITNTGQHLDHSVGLLECIQRVEAELHLLCEGHDPFEPQRVDGQPDLRRAWGFAIAFKNTGLGGGAPDKAGAEVELYGDGSIETRTSSAEIGQGLVSVLQMITAEELGTDLEQVRVLLSDTDRTLDGGPTTGSRQTFVSGNAVRYAASALRQAMSATLSEKYDVPPESIRYVGGLAQVDGQHVSFAEIASLMRQEGREPRVSYEYWAPKTAPLGEGGDMHFAFSFAAQAAEVEVNLVTGEVRVPHVIAATDVGQAINPLGLQGQIEGGVVMGLGHTLTEEFILENGQVITDRMARYRMPAIHQAPQITSIVVEHPTREGPYGAKGVGEISTMPTPPAILNGIYHACGVRLRCLPVDQDSLALKIASQTQA
ncbi:MAG: molybdopterin-dependent oxidoreductase [Anaerolineales bacterium]|jgi:CO/xanthine dehydrogenase Mo-binding subunit/aerobic-type carbon monoxide dehydrogenase small subunit (CoxS/CutS family)